jgi:hypothetical protein
MCGRKTLLPIRILYLYSTCKLFVDIITGYLDTPFIQFRTAHPSALKISPFSELEYRKCVRLHIYPSLIKHHKMKAVGLNKHLPIEDPQSLVDLDIQEPNHPTGHDLLVTIKAISVNPLDTKVRRGTIPPNKNENMPHVLGWDAAGEVIAAGSD